MVSLDVWEYNMVSSTYSMCTSIKWWQGVPFFMRNMGCSEETNNCEAAQSSVSEQLIRETGST